MILDDLAAATRARVERKKARKESLRAFFPAIQYTDYNIL